MGRWSASHNELKRVFADNRQCGDFYRWLDTAWGCKKDKERHGGGWFLRGVRFLDVLAPSDWSWTVPLPPRMPPPVA
jgi:hypothetical protein